MKLNIILNLLTLTLIYGSQEWSYKGENGPERWGLLKKEYSACSEGKRQSPIALNQGSYFTKTENYVNPWKDSDKSFGYANNGHSLTVDLKDLKVPFKLDCKNLELKQFHVHTPAEHTVDGKTYDLEAHFVFTNSKSNLFQVFGVFFQQDDKLTDNSGFFNSVLNKSNSTINIKDSKIDFKGLNLGQLYNQVDGFKSGYVYRGSLTTPPCTEAVRFIISDKILPISKAQLDVFKLSVHDNNARPIQKLTEFHQPSILDFKKCEKCITKQS
ncbi:carbonic anhydrase [Neoconidiobolus thromboides FSU 785]|nr:carbonic anhydrase [Neoconidiobolus thromboides FSU 785]